MSTFRLIVLITILFSLTGCRSASSAQRAKALTGEAEKLVEQQTKIVEEWTGEYSPAFTPQKRAEFPANRDWLRSRADRVITLLNESSRLANEAADKYDQASQLVNGEKETKARALFASSFRKEVEVNDLLKAQMHLVSDGEVRDARTFNQK